MTKLQGFGFAIAFAVGVAGVWGACASPTGAGGVLLTGSWASGQGRLTATESFMRFVSPCGSGGTNEPIMLDRQGNFNLQGTYGVVGQAPSEARFRGSIAPRQLTLQVFMADSTKAVGPITLDLGQQTVVGVCR